MLHRLFILLSIPAIVASFVACGGGTVGDPGGGGIGKSTNEQVMLAIEDAIDLFKLEEFIGPFDVFESLKGMISEKDLTTETGKQVEILKKIIKQGKHRETLEKSKIYYDMSGCPGVEKHKEAAVSEHKVGANLCFDVEELKQFPPSQLKREIYALLVHEYLHLLGYREDVAKIFQDLLTNNWDRFEFYQLDVAHVHQMDIYVQALSLFDLAGHLLDLGKNQEAQKQVEIAHGIMRELAGNASYLSLGFQMRVGDRVALRKVMEEMQESLDGILRGTEMLRKPIAKEVLGEVFCALAELQPRFRESMLLKESPYFNRVKKGEIVLNTEKSAFECPKIPSERFKFIGMINQKQIEDKE